MTTSAHGARRVWSGATRKPGGVTGPRNEWYKELHPEMYKEIPSSKPVKPAPKPKPKRQVAKKQETKPATPKFDSQEIVNYLRNGDATAQQIAEALNVSHTIIRMRLWRGIDGVVRKGTHVPERGSPGQEWGIKDAKLP